MNKYSVIAIMWVCSIASAYFIGSSAFVFCSLFLQITTIVMLTED